MRNPDRIDDILNRIKVIWKEYPDLRLGQLICNMVSERILYFVEDEDLIDAIERGYYESDKKA